MKIRHQEYQESARILKDAGVYNEAVACYYYSVLHRMMYALVNDPVNPHSYKDFSPINEDSHEKIKGFILSTGKMRGKDKDNFKSDFSDLKVGCPICCTTMLRYYPSNSLKICKIFSKKSPKSLVICK